MAEDDDNSVPDQCAVCGKKLTAGNRSGSQPDLCKMCAGEEDEQDEVDDFK